MPEHRGSGRKDVATRVDLANWGLFALMMVLGLLIPVVGMVTRAAGPWDWRLVSIYSLWIVTTVVFGGLNMYKTKAFILHILYYTASISVVFAFFSKVLKSTSETMSMYIPILTDLGIFLGIAVAHVWSISQERLRRFSHTILDWILHVMHNFEGRQFDYREGMELSNRRSPTLADRELQDLENGPTGFPGTTTLNADET